MTGAATAALYVRCLRPANDLLCDKIDTISEGSCARGAAWTITFG